MPLESPLADLHDRARDLNRRHRNNAAVTVLEHALSDPLVGPVALVSSFGAESVVLLHMVSRIDRTLPVLFLQTGMLFAETLSYQRELSRDLGLTDVRLLTPDRTELFTDDHDGLLHLADPDACCALRKSRPLAAGLSDFNAWITGRKRFQGGQRQSLDFFEADSSGNTPRLKINPLAHWRAEDVAAYIDNNRLPRHPMVARGYPSIGCAPCTGPVDPGRDPRAGRWPGMGKTECGIHFGARKAGETRAPATTSGEGRKSRKDTT